jgi:hypothetical protein
MERQKNVPEKKEIIETDKPEDQFIDNVDNKPSKQDIKRSERSLYIAVFVIIILVAAVFAAAYIFPNIFRPAPKTIDDLIQDNIEGKLDEDQGYIYKGFSFVKVGPLWYTQIEHAGKEYNIPLHYSPRDLQDVDVIGDFNAELFNNVSFFYMTFEPLGEDLKYVAVATSEIDQNLVYSFDITPIAACAYNETEACENRPIVNCTNTNHPAIFIRSADKRPTITFSETCILIEGRQEGILKAADKLILSWYGIV